MENKENIENTPDTLQSARIAWKTQQKHYKTRRKTGKHTRNITTLPNKLESTPKTLQNPRDNWKNTPKTLHPRKNWKTHRNIAKPKENQEHTPKTQKQPSQRTTIKV